MSKRLGFGRFLYFILFLNLFLCSKPSLAAIPPIPATPQSDEGFAEIRSYYKMDQGFPRYQVQSIRDQSLNRSVYRHVEIKTFHPQTNSELHFKMVLKIPLGLKPGRYPAVILFTGFQTGSDAVDLIDSPKDIITIGFSYPLPFRVRNYQRLIDWSTFEAIPVTMVSGLHWIQQQSYINIFKLNILSTSFGTIFTPITLRWLNICQFPIAATILGYGGGHIPVVVGQELRKYMGSNETGVAQTLIAQQTWLYEPANHVAKLTGNFLIVHGADDDVFPEESKSVFNDHLGGIKKIITLPGPHIQPDRKDIIQNFIRAVFEYLLEQNTLM